MKVCAELLHAGWVEWHRLGVGWWWSAERLRALPATVPSCPRWVYSPDASVSFVTTTLA